jgi:hypothetical protein
MEMDQDMFLRFLIHVSLILVEIVRGITPTSAKWQINFQVFTGFHWFSLVFTGFHWFSLVFNGFWVSGNL